MSSEQTSQYFSLPPQKFIISATLKAASEFSQQLENLLAPLPLDVRVNVTLAVQELCVNIVNHAYSGLEGVIEIEVATHEDEFRLTLTDYAPNAYHPPAEISAPDPLELPEHGMGMYIIHKTFDDIQYQHSATGNRWYLMKRDQR